MCGGGAVGGAGTCGGGAGGSSRRAGRSGAGGAGGARRPALPARSASRRTSRPGRGAAAAPAAPPAPPAPPVPPAPPGLRERPAPPVPQRRPQSTPNPERSGNPQCLQSHTAPSLPSTSGAPAPSSAPAPPVPAAPRAPAPASGRRRRREKRGKGAERPRLWGEKGWGRPGPPRWPGRAVWGCSPCCLSLSPLQSAPTLLVPLSPVSVLPQPHPACPGPFPRSLLPPSCAVLSFILPVRSCPSPFCLLSLSGPILPVPIPSWPHPARPCPHPACARLHLIFCPSCLPRSRLSVHRTAPGRSGRRRAWGHPASFWGRASSAGISPVWTGFHVFWENFIRQQHGDVRCLSLSGRYKLFPMEQNETLPNTPLPLPPIKIRALLPTGQGETQSKAVK